MRSSADQVDERRHPLMLLDRVSKRKVLAHAIDVAPPFPFVGDVTVLLEVRDDALYRALGDPYAICEVADPSQRIGGDAQEHVGVVRQERPPRLRGGLGRAGRAARLHRAHARGLVDWRFRIRAISIVRRPPPPEQGSPHDGADYVAESDLLPEALSHKLKIHALPGYRLTSLSNRGAVVWPRGSPLVNCVDAYSARFASTGPARADEILRIAEAISGGFRLCSVDVLLRVGDRVASGPRG